MPFEEVADTPDKESTITPSEAEVFKGIFDEIAQGRMASSVKQRRAVWGDKTVGATEEEEQQRQQRPGMARSIVEQARVRDFRERTLRRYPASLRNAAQVALGLYELEPTDGVDSKMVELEEADQARWRERATYEAERSAERERVDGLMRSCQTDVALWRVMEEQVFSLPAKLGIAQKAPRTRKPKQYVTSDQHKVNSSQKSALPANPGIAPAKKAHRTRKPKPEQGAKSDSVDVESSNQSTSTDKDRVMNVLGPLYPHFINTGLALFETGFARPSDYAFQILPRIKQLGLASYVLGVSTPFYARLARAHWFRFGDASSALDVLQEMNSAGLCADEEVHGVLRMIRDHMHGCTWGAQGPFVMGIMEAPPYDGVLTQRLEDMERYTVQSMNERAAELAEA